jgi:AraC-like DNA-binding protein
MVPREKGGEVSVHSSLEERVRVRRMAPLGGVEVLEVENSDREWRIFNIAHCIAVPSTWLGEANYRRRRVSVRPGMVFCTEPGEIHTTPRVVNRGSFNVLIIEPDTFREYLHEHGAEARNPRWRAIAATASPGLLRRLALFFQSLRPECSPLELQSTAVSLMETLAFELVDDPPPPSGGTATDLDRAAARIRECLHGDGGGQLDLAALASAVGMSRFQVLRAFKRRYGVPPHAYRLCIQVGLARQLLVDGSSVADAAAQSGFADQSHLARHFRRALGITPTAYAQTHAVPGHAHPTAAEIAERERIINRILNGSDAGNA